MDEPAPDIGQAYAEFRAAEAASTQNATAKEAAQQAHDAALHRLSQAQSDEAAAKAALDAAVQADLGSVARVEAAKQGMVDRLPPARTYSFNGGQSIFMIIPPDNKLHEIVVHHIQV